MNIFSVCNELFSADGQKHRQTDRQRDAARKSLLQWTLSEIFGPRNFYKHENIYIYIYIIFNFALVYITCAVFTMHKCNCNTSPVANDARLFIHLFKSRYSSPHVINKPNSKLLTCSTKETHTSIRLRKVRMCTDSLGIQLHSVALICRIERIGREVNWS